ncbi:adenosine deaminase 2-like [Leguminivora glycinivorella]|uniref:adenosine deaminase 2-like n=1 Tax=Leguminivora glycinivorella TaxID=1035111 RepID=UPI00200DE9F1|nr:adenosine deaminase 2-like [Leguminivora glycinivorella]
MRLIVIANVLCLLSARARVIDDKLIINDYTHNRADLLELELHESVGGKLHLSDKEQAANAILMRLKEKELDHSFNNPQFFNFSRPYFTYKDDMKHSKVYQLIRRMPKGAALHVHSSLMLDADYLVSLTYENHLYACLTDDDLILHFSNAEPVRPCPVKWNLLSTLRHASDDVEQFDAKLKEHFTLGPEDNMGFNTNVNEAWKEFNKVYHTIKSLINYRPVREKMFYQALKDFYNDNVMYIEIRSGLSSLYELDGTQHDKIYLAVLYKEITEKFMKDNPGFMGVKIIVTRARSASVEQVRESLNLARQLKKAMPCMFAGFDLVGQEDMGKPLNNFLPDLLGAKDEINYYFHGGETNWYGSPTDENLFDAILLGSKRIGHGYALIKHPALMKAVHRKDIAIEVNVISNSVLSLVQDLRNHPLGTYLALGLPVVLSSDDPGVWGAKPMSDDFYVAFVAIASRHADLRMLKQLAINSIRYSALNDKGKTTLFKSFEKKWEDFIDSVISW